jgi:hypothetical protein
MKKFPKFITYGVRPDIKREINNRGKKQIRKDSDGIVKKTKKISASSSLFGWGAVNDTILNSKDILPVFKNLNILIAQINYMEIEPAQKKSKSIQFDKLPNPSIPSSIRTTAPLIQQWFDQCHYNLENGSIGLVPECYINGGLPGDIEEWRETNVGQVLMNFMQFVKKFF